MNFAPKSETELQEENLLVEGIYDFEVVDAKDRVSKSGNEMIELKLRIKHSTVSQKIIFDYLLESMGFKLKHFTDISNLSSKYQMGLLLANDCIGKVGKVHIVISPAKDNFSAKNSVKDYITLEKLKDSPKQETEKNDFINDDLPF